MSKFTDERDKIEALAKAEQAEIKDKGFAHWAKDNKVIVAGVIIAVAVILVLVF